MAFNSEEDMKEAAVNSFCDHLASDRGHIIDEFSYGSGRADLVVARESELYRSHREDGLGISSAIDDDSCLRTFLLLHSKETISREYFLQIGAMDRRKQDQALEWLLSKGFVMEESDGKIRTAPDLRCHVTTSFAIELKISKWQKALRQAHRGKCFSEYQYVVLDQDHVLPALENEDVFREYNIGLVALDTDGEFFVHHSPEKQNPYSPLNKWRLNETTIIDGVGLGSYAD